MKGIVVGRPISILAVSVQCGVCGWAGIVKECEPDVDGNGSLGCPRCRNIVQVNEPLQRLGGRVKTYLLGYIGKRAWEQNQPPAVKFVITSGVLPIETIIRLPGGSYIRVESVEVWTETGHTSVYEQGVVVREIYLKGELVS